MSASSTTKPIITGIDIHTYLVKDTARAVAFWRDIMGFQLGELYGDQGAEFILPDGSWFGLWKLSDEEGGWRPGSGIMFAVPDINAAVAHFRAKGVRIEANIEESPICFMAFAQDSEGNSFIIHQRKV